MHMIRFAWFPLAPGFSQRFCRGARMGGHTGADLFGGRVHPRRQHACVRHRVEYLDPGDGIRRRCRARPDPDQPACRYTRSRSWRKPFSSTMKKSVSRRSIAILFTTSDSSSTTPLISFTSNRQNCRWCRAARISVARSAWLATTRANSCRSSPARSQGSIAKRRTTAAASTTTSIRSICRRRRVRQAVPRARRSSISRVRSSR